MLKNQKKKNFFNIWDIEKKYKENIIHICTANFLPILINIIYISNNEPFF